MSGNHYFQPIRFLFFLFFYQTERTVEAKENLSVWTSAVCYKWIQLFLNENLYFFAMSHPKQRFPYFINHAQVSHTIVPRYVRLIRMGVVKRIPRGGRL